MLCLIHGYALSGSGSNLWTRSVTQALCRNGETVHLVCQDRRPEQYDFVSAAYEYRQGLHTTLFEREVSYPGHCILHRPHLDLLPVYVRPPSGVTSMVAIPDLPDAQIDEYLRRNEAALLQIVRENEISVMHVNHVVLMSVVARRVSQQTGIPFAVMPHGSALEYVVKQDPRMPQLATEALNAADRILFLSEELKERVREALPGLEELDRKAVKTNVGVDSGQFKLVSRSERKESIGRLKETVEKLERGKRPQQLEFMNSRLHEDASFAALQDLIQTSADYLKQRPDADLEQKLDRIDWERDDVLVYVGKLIGHKGIPALIAAFPWILDQKPHTRLIIVGRGPLREVLEVLVWALAHRNSRLVHKVVEWGGALEGDGEEQLTRVAAYFGKLEQRGALNAYFDLAANVLSPDRVIFTGHLEHNALSLLYPCCDVAVFPSIVPEAGPMVLLEAMSSGCFPMGSYFAGMGANIDIASLALPVDQARYMKLRREPEHAVEDIIQNVPQALDLGGSYRKSLREIAIQHYDWVNIAGRLSKELHHLARQSP